MSSEKNDQEPSMEEILSSIRRIIADENDEDDDTLGHGDVEDDGFDLEALQKNALDRADQPADDAAAKDAPKDAPKDAADDEPDAADDEPDAAEAPDEGEEDDVLELTEVVPDEDLPARAKPAAMESLDALENAADDALHSVEDELEFAADKDHDEPDELTKETAAVADAKKDELISSAAAAASTGAFARLAKAAASDKPAAEPVPADGRTVEELVTDMLKPMLRDWLEQHLPGIVERVVEQEVKKLARRAELL